MLTCSGKKQDSVKLLMVHLTQYKALTLFSAVILNNGIRLASKCLKLQLSFGLFPFPLKHSFTYLIIISHFHLGK